MPPLVSVVIPTYNSRNSVCAAIKSVLNQTHTAQEIVVVDDGSTDRTKESLKPYIDTLLITYIYQENKGQGAARNNGVQHAKGDWVAFLDADDEWLPNHLSEMVNAISSSKASIVTANAHIFKSDTFVWDHHDKVKPHDENVYRNLLDENFIILSATAVKKSVLLDQNLFNESKWIREVEDYDLWLRLSKTNQLSCIKQPTVRYNLNPSKKNSNHIKHVRNAIIRILLRELLGDTIKDKSIIISRLYKLLLL